MANTARSGHKRLCNCVILFPLLSLAFQTAGLVCPAWEIVKDPTFSYQTGLFFMITCILEVCETETTGAYLDSPTKRLHYSELKLDDIREYQSEAILGWSSCLMALLVTIKLKHCGGLPKLNWKWYLVLSLTTLLSAAMALTAAGKWGGALIWTKDRLKESSNEVKTPYGLILTGVGGLLAAILFLLTTIEICMVFNEREPVQSPNAVSSSTVGQSYTVPTPQPSAPLSSSPQYPGLTPSAPPLKEYHVQYHVAPPSYPVPTPQPSAPLSSSPQYPGLTPSAPPPEEYHVQYHVAPPSYDTNHGQPSLHIAQNPQTGYNPNIEYNSNLGYSPNNGLNPNKELYDSNNTL